MKTGYAQLHIYYPAEKELHGTITEILKTIPDERFLEQDLKSGAWNLYIKAEDDEWVEFINTFLDMLEGKYEALESIGIERDNIIFYVVYRYLDNCDLKFRPTDLARIGRNGITLCISCWEDWRLEEDGEKETSEDI